MGNLIMSELKRLTDNFIFLEGPRWHHGQLYVSDMWGKKVYSIDSAGVSTELVEIINRPSGIGFMSNEAMLVSSMADKKVLIITDGNKISTFCDLEPLVEGDINDLVVDANDNVYVGNFGYDLFAGAKEAPGSICLIKSDGTSSIVADNLAFPNGMVIDVENKILICAETFGHKLTAFDLNPDGTLCNERIWAELGDNTPDGICLDEDGAIWVASFVTEKFIRVLEGGEIQKEICVKGKKAVACNLGGRDRKTLYCLTYNGELEDISKGLPRAEIYTCQVETAGAGSP